MGGIAMKQKNMTKGHAALAGEVDEDGLYPEVEMMIEQEAYRAFLEAAEYGAEGVEHLLKTIEQLRERMEYYGDY